MLWNMEPERDGIKVGPPDELSAIVIKINMRELQALTRLSKRMQHSGKTPVMM